MAKGKKEDLIHLLHELLQTTNQIIVIYFTSVYLWVACSVSQAHIAWSQSFLFKDFLKISTTQMSSKSCAIPLYAPGVDGVGRATSGMAADKCIIGT